MLPERLTISHYRILSHIGAGGMGEVYLAEDINLGRRVALKVLPHQFNSDEDRLRRFEQEARAASALNHPNIITIHEVGAESGTRFIATEFIEGETVRQKIKQSGISIREALDIAIQVARALAAAHRVGIVHRDIKPENVMIRPDGIAKVLDFGVVKLTERFAEHLSGPQTHDDEHDVATFGFVTTEANIVMGSPNYMSPEQARGLTVDARTDIFSLGALLYEMLTGKMPFKGPSVSDVIVAILERQPPPLSECVPESPPKLQAIVERAMAKNIDARYQIIDDLIHDLKQVRRRLELESGIDDSLRPVHAGESAKTDPQQRDTASEPAPQADHIPTVQATSSAEFILGEIKNHKRGLVIALASAVSIIVLFVYFSIFAKAHPIDSIAVLPFINISSDPNTEYLSEGLTESLINNLSQSHSLKVMSRNSVFKYSGQEADPKRVGRELGVHGVVTGRIVQRGDTISINVELIDARDDTQVWGEQLNRRMSDLSSLQEEIARQVSDRLQLRLSGDDEKRLTKRRTDDAEAYQLYLKGRFYWNKRTEEGLKKALPYFNQAIERDPSYALAHAGLADCFALLYEYSATPSKDLYPKAKAAALRALELDESLAEAHTSLAAAYEYEWNWNEAAKQYERAIELNQNYETAHHWYSAYLISRRQFDEAIREAQRAVDLDPLSLIINTALGRALHSAKRYDEAIEQLRKTLDMDPNFAEAHFHLGLAYEGKGSYDDAIRELTKASELFADKSMLAWAGRAYALSGRRTEALKILEDMINLSKQQQVPPYAIASLYAALGEKDRAFEWLEKVYQERNYYVVFLNVDPALDSLRSDARFSDLLGRIGLG
jgi:eukaryotic-like serine/threonine-protein kinase